MRLSVKTYGVARLNKSLAARAAAGVAAGKSSEQVGAELLARTAISLAPFLTGKLVGGIDPTGSTYVTTGNAGYAAYQEFGTPKMKANPFMRPATRMVARAYRSAVVAATAKAMR